MPFMGMLRPCKTKGEMYSMRPIQNADGHVGLTARNYPIAAAAAISQGQVVKLSAGLVAAAAAAETGAILGIASETHSGSFDALNPRSNGTELLVCDNPGLLFECHAPTVKAASGSATTVVAASNEVASTIADDAFNGGVLVLVRKAAASTNTDPVGARITVTDYAKSGTTFTKPSGGTPAAGDEYELYPPVGSAVCALDANAQKLIVSATGATSIRVVGHDIERHMLRCMAAVHTLT